MREHGKLYAIVSVLAICAFALVFMGCPEDDNGGDSGGGGNGGGSGASVGCHDLSPGTECTANSSCSNHFLCLTGQGSDNNCTTGCSCQ